VFNLLRGGILLPLELILIPFVLHRIGVAGFGIWALLRVFIGYGNIFDLGISVALEKYTAEHAGHQNYDFLNRLINSAFLVYLIISLLIVFGVFLFGGWIGNHFFSEGLKAFGDLYYILLVSAGACGINLLLSIGVSLLNGIQRIDLTNTLSAASALLNFIGILFVLGLGYGLKGMVVINGVVVLTMGLTGLWIARQKLPEVHLNPFGPFLDCGECFRIISYSLSVQTTRFAGLIHIHVAKFYLSYFWGLHYVTYYEIASRLVERMKALPQMLIQPIMAAASDLDAKGKGDEVNRIYIGSLRYMILLTLPFFVFISFFIKPLMKLWLGNIYPLTIEAFLILSVAHFINVLTGPGFLIFLGIGRLKYGVISSIAGGLSDIVLGYIFIIILGFHGTLLANFLALVLPSAGFIFFFHRIRKLSSKQVFLTLLLKPLMICLSVAIFTSVSVPRLIGEGLGGFAVSFLVFLVLYGIGTWIALINKEDQQSIKSYLHDLQYQIF
jgi:O-antigen/teichoic acid export membrane protein